MKALVLPVDALCSHLTGLADPASQGDDQRVEGDRFEEFS